MNTENRSKGIVIALVVLSLIIGLVGGYVLAHRSMTEMPSGKAGVSAPAGLAGEKDKNVEMPEMPGMKQEQNPGTVSPPAGTVVLPATQRQLIGVRTATVGYALLGEEIRAVGTINYDERKLTQVNLRVSGWIQKVLVDAVGKPVRKGEPLLTLYSPDLLASQDEYLLALRSQAQLGGSPMPEAKSSAAALVTSARERLKLWNLTDEQVARLEQRGKSDATITVYAPSSGIVLKREALPGKYVEPGTTLYELADLSTVWIHADVYESQIAVLKLNQPAAATFDAYPGETFKGKVQYIYPYLNETTRTVRVRLELPNPKLKLKPGMYGNVLIQTDQQERLVVPKEAVLDTGPRQIVFLDQGNGVYVPTQVKLGRRSEDKVEVLEGLKKGDQVVTSANFLLDAQSKLASTGNMQEMMGQIGMADWQMRGAYEAKMENMPGMSGMGAKSTAKPLAETSIVGGYTLTLTTQPEIPKAGEAVLRLRVIDQAGKPVSNAQVAFVYTMAMPGMSEAKAAATHTKEGIYEAKALLGMAGRWDVTVQIVVPGRPSLHEKFSFSVAG